MDRQLIAPKTFYFMFYAAMGSLMPYLVLYYSGIGLSAMQIGLLTGIGPLITLIAAPFWGGFADLTRRHKLTLVLAITGSMVMMHSVSRVSSLWMLFPIIALYAWFSAPVIPLVDNSVLALLGSRRDEYGRQRLWGAVGWGIAGLAAGIAIDRYGNGVSFAAYLFLMGAALIAAYKIPVADAVIGTAFWQGIKLLALNKRWIVFLITVWIAAIGGGVTMNFLFLYLEDLGASRSLMGMSLMVATLSEIPVFFYSNRLLGRWGAVGLLSIAMAAYIVRLLAYAFMPSAWYVLPINMLHGMTFSALWVAGVSFAHELAPPGLGATAQGLFSGVTMGLGAATGALLGGYLYGVAGPEAMFISVALLGVFGLALFWFSEISRRRRIAIDAV